MIIGDTMLQNGLSLNTKHLCRSTTNAAYDLEANQIPASNYNNPLATGTAQQVKFEESRDWSDWILFAIGWICGITWIVGALRPLCRRPRFPAARNKAGWIANVIGKPATPPLNLGSGHCARPLCNIEKQIPINASFALAPTHFDHNAAASLSLVR